MICIYIGVMIILAILYCCTDKYNKGKINDKFLFLSKLKKLDGMSMFIVDLYSRHIRTDNKKRSSNRNKLSKIYLKENVSQLSYAYSVRKLSLSICVLVVVILIGIAAQIGNISNKDKIVKELERLGNGQGEMEYDIVAEIEDEKESIHLKVGEQKYSDTEKEKIFEKSYDAIVEQMLGKNKSEDSIMYPLDFIDSFGESNIKIEWDLDDVDIVDYDGKVYRDSNEHNVTVVMKMSLEDFEKQYEINLRVLPEKKYTQSIQQKVQESVNEQDEYKKEVKLPDKIDGKNVSFLMHGDLDKTPYLVIAIIIAVIVYFLKDRDMDKELEIRKKELENDYSRVVSKLMLLISAGMTVKNAWIHIVNDYIKLERDKKKRYVYEEMLFSFNMMKSGQSEIECYRTFGKRCGLHEYIKLCGILEQNILKGTKGMKVLLEYEVHEAFENRKMLAKKRGDETGTKMLVPMVIMLIIAMAIIVVPSFLSMETGIG